MSKKFPNQRETTRSADESPRQGKMRLRERSYLADELYKDRSSQESNFLTSGDIVLVQTAQTKVANTETKQRDFVRILMASGSQRTYVTKNVVKGLQLRFGIAEEFP